MRSAEGKDIRDTGLRQITAVKLVFDVLGYRWIPHNASFGFLRLWTGFELPSSHASPSESKWFDFCEVASHCPWGTGSQRHLTAKIIVSK
jgi:hypothetical protein